MSITSQDIDDNTVPRALHELVVAERDRLKAECDQPPRWLSDPDDETSVDDLFATGAIHLERMSSTHYWLGVTVGGVTYHVDLHSKRRITAFARELPPRKVRT